LIFDSISSVGMAFLFGFLVGHTYDASFCPMGSVVILEVGYAFMSDVVCSDLYSCSMHKQCAISNSILIQ
jgi:hypothetical protein